MLLEIFYFIGFSGILWLIAKQLLRDKQTQIITLCGFAIFVIYSKISAFSAWFPYFPDTQGFARLVEDADYHSSSLGVQLYSIVILPLRWLSFHQLELYLITQQFLFAISIIMVWKAWVIHAGAMKYRPGHYGVFMLLMVLYPSILMFISVPLREFFMVFGFSLFLYGVAQYIHFGKMKWLVIGSVLTIFIRPQLVILYPLLVVAAKQKNYLKLGLIGIVLLILVIPVFELLTGYRFTPEFFAFLRERGTTHYAESGMTYGSVTWQSYFDIILDLPGLTLQFLLSPLPILHNVNPLNLKLMLLDLVFVLAVLWGALWNNLSLSSAFLKMFLLASVIFSIWEFYIGGAVRHRMPLVIMIMPLAACYYSKVVEKLTSKVREK